MLCVWFPSKYLRGFKPPWILCRGGCSGWGVQWIGVVSYSKLVYNVI